MILAANTIDDVNLNENAKAHLANITTKIHSERKKRLEVEAELREVLA